MSSQPTREQRCTVHKTANVLNKLPKSLQPQAKRLLHDIWQAPSRAEANKAFDLFQDTFEAKYLQATECLAKDRDELLAFYNFPAENWCHIRTTNPIESTFATIPAPSPKDPRLRFGKSVSDNDVQARSECFQRLEKTPRTHPPQRPSPRSSIHRRRKRAHAQRKETATFLRNKTIQRNRRLNQQISNTTFDSYSHFLDTLVSVSRTCKPFFSVSINTGNTHTERIITVTLNAAGNIGPVDGEVLIAWRGDKPGVISIPIRAFVSGPAALLLNTSS